MNHVVLRLGGLCLPVQVSKVCGFLHVNSDAFLFSTESSLNVDELLDNFLGSSILCSRDISKHNVFNFSVKIFCEF